MNKIRSILSPLSSFLPIAPLVNLSKQKLFLPYYHSVQGAYDLVHIKHLYQPKTKIEFERDLDFLLQNFTPISFFDLKNHLLNQNPFEKPCFHLSFDDGLSEIYDIVLPILEKKGIPATFFLNTDFIDNRDLFYRYKVSLIIEKIKGKVKNQKEIQKLLNFRFKDISTIDEIAQKYQIDFNDFLKTQQPYLTTPQIEKIIQKGYTIGAHSLNHPHYEDLKLEDQILQTTESLNLLQKRFALDYGIFSFPFTDFGVTEHFFDEIFANDSVDFTFSSAGLKKDKLQRHLHRTQMEDHGKSGKDIIKTEYLYYLLKSFLGKNTAKRDC